MKRILFKILMTGMLVYLCSGLRTTKSTKTGKYSSAQYQKQLSSRQDKLAEQIKLLKAQLDKMDEIISDANTTTSTKIVKLQDGIADEQETLYQIQAFLSLPYSVKKCQCKLISDQQKQKLQQQIAIINQDILSLENNIKQCGSQCKEKGSISNLKAYASAIQEIIDSECCRRRKQFSEQFASGVANLNDNVFKDNLKSDNWYYGSITQDEYRLKLFELTTKFNIKNCPIETPFFNASENTCFKCEKEGELFNLGQRVCYYCNQLQFLNQTTNKCVDCPEQQFYNRTLKKCEGCSAKQFLNTTSKQCENCKLNLGQYFDKEEGKCKKCPQGQEYNLDAKKCRQCNVTASEYLNPSNFTCQFCPSTDFYNTTAKQCQPCSPNSFFSKDTGKCSKCPPHSLLNKQKMKCEKCEENSYLDEQKMECVECPHGKTFMKEENECKCPSQRPAYNQKAKLCEACHSEFTWDKDLKKCLYANNMGVCPDDKPFYDTTVHQCKQCKQGTHYVASKYNCQPIQRHRFLS